MKTQIQSKNLSAWIAAFVASGIVVEPCLIARADTATLNTTQATTSTATTSTPTATASDAPLSSDFNTVCGPVLANVSGTANPDQSVVSRVSDCQEAKVDRAAAKTQGDLAVVWGLVAVDCAIVCGMQFPPSASACYIPQGAAMLNEIVQTQELEGLADAFTKGPAAVLAAGMMTGPGKDVVSKGFINNGPKMVKGADGKMYKAGPDGKPTTEQPKSKRDKNTCYVAAYAASQAIGKLRSKQEHLNKAKEHVLRAAEFAKNAAQKDVTTAPQGPPGAANLRMLGGNVSGDGGSRNNTVGSDGSAYPGASSSGSSTTASQSASCTDGVVHCSVAKDSKLPDYVKNPEIADNAAKQGYDIDSLAKGGLTPSALSSALGNATGNPSGVASAMKDLEDKNGLDAAKLAAVSEDVGAYSQGSGASGGGGSAANPMDAITGMMGNLLGQLGTPKEENDRRISQIEFAAQKRGPASLADDPKFSLFDRVSFRYRNVTKKLFQP